MKYTFIILLILLISCEKNTDQIISDWEQINIDSLSSKYISCIDFDRDSIIWISARPDFDNYYDIKSYDGGLFAFKENKWKRILYQSINLIKFDDFNNLWIVFQNGEGIVKYSNKVLKYYNSESGYDISKVLSFDIYDNIVYLGTETGLKTLNIENDSLLTVNLYEYNYEKIDNIHVLNSNNIALSIYSESIGVILNNKPLFFTPEELNVAQSLFVSSIDADQDNNLYFFSNRGPIFFEYNDTIPKKLNLKGYNGAIVSSSYIKDSLNYILGTGTIRFSPPNGYGLYVRKDSMTINYNTQNSDIPDNHINKILIGDENYIWIATWKGLVKIKYDKL